MSTINETSKREKQDNWNGNIRERADGRWEARIMTEGIYKSFYGKTKADVKKKLRIYRDTRSNEAGDKKTPLQDYIANYLITYKLGIIKESTYDRYESTFLHHVYNTPLGRKPIGVVNDSDIIKHLKLKISPLSPDEMPLSRSSVKKILELLNMACKHAHMKGKIPNNPAVGVKLPGEDNFLVKTKKIECLDDGQMAQIKRVSELKRKNGKPFYRASYLIMILLNTGLRCGELLALTWDDIDFQNNLIYVSQGIMTNVNIRDAAGNILERTNKLASPKTNKAVRSIPINQQCCYYLNLLLEEKEKSSIDTDFVAYSEAGTRMTFRNLQRAFDLILIKAELPHYSLHILRHSFGSQLIRNGVDVTIVSKLMGHSNITITYNKYIHVLQSQQIRAIELANVI